LIIIPSVDIKGGRCVRLVEGREGTETVFGDDPADWALKWVRAGAKYLHVVDLDGAFQGAPRNLGKVKEIVQRAGVPVEFGGGVRDSDVVDALLAAGIARIILGSSLVDRPEWAGSLLRIHPGKIAVGIDAVNGKVAIHGWKKVTKMNAIDLARECEGMGATAVIYTDIARDGKMQGANLVEMTAMVKAVSMPVIASGGVTTIDDVKLLAEAGCHGAIIGRALYEGKISLSEAIAAAKGAGTQP
jgi:phosphoribosylformimino-5-aminoimidazole carboxamide ribotide isomerase